MAAAQKPHVLTPPVTVRARIGGMADDDWYKLHCPPAPPRPPKPGEHVWSLRKNCSIPIRTRAVGPSPSHVIVSTRKPSRPRIRVNSCRDPMCPPWCVTTPRAHHRSSDAGGAALPDRD